MSVDGARQAAQVLRTYLVTAGQPDGLKQTSAIATLIYAARLNDPPIYPDDPDAVDLVCDRFGHILTDHIALAAVILIVAAEESGKALAEVLDDIVHRHLGGYT